ncbi:MAG: hypothetical protein KDA79_01070 [Planctomycetaceae bacterium]|nr:hypothetical protein [Planctomycetaceae bacterium]
MSQSPVSRRRRALISRQGAEESSPANTNAVPSASGASRQSPAPDSQHPSLAGTWWTGRPLASHPKSLIEQVRSGEVDQTKLLIQYFVNQPCSCGDSPEGSGMSVSRFEQLLEQLPRIAQVINAFESTEIQREVFDAVLQVYLQEVQLPAGEAVQEASPLPETEPAAELAVAELVGGGSAIDDDDLDDASETGLRLDLAADSTTRPGSRGTTTAGGDSIHSFIQG